MARNFCKILLDKEDSLVSNHKKVSRSPKGSMVLQWNTSVELGKQDNYRFNSDFNRSYRLEFKQNRRFFYNLY